MQLRAIIFDFDGVLADTMHLHLESEQKLFAKLGLKISKGELAKLFGMSVREFIEWVLKKYGINADTEELIEEKYGILDELIGEKGVRAIPGAAEFAEKVKRKGIGFALASGSRKKFVFHVLEKIGLGEFFPVVLGEEDVEKGKPDAEIFLRCAELLSVKPGECLVIEDSENGIIAAKKAGMKVMALKSGYSGEQDLSEADRIINAFDEIELEGIQRWFD